MYYPREFQRRYGDVLGEIDVMPKPYTSVYELHNNLVYVNITDVNRDGYKLRWLSFIGLLVDSTVKYRLPRMVVRRCNSVGGSDYPDKYKLLFTGNYERFLEHYRDYWEYPCIQDVYRFVRKYPEYQDFYFDLSSSNFMEHNGEYVFIDPLVGKKGLM